MSEPKIKYDIEAAVKGEASVEQLAATVRDLGNSLDGDLKKQAVAAADALQALGAKQAAVDNFKTLRRETESLTTALTGAAQRVDQLGTELPQATAATQGFASAEAQARAAVDAARRDLDEMRAALRTLREEYTGAARGSDAYRESNAQLRSTVKDLRDNLTQKRQELTAASQATRTAQQAEKSLTTEYSNAVGAARQLSSELGNKNRALDASRTTLRAVGIETTDLAQAERNLQTAVTGVRQQVATLGPAFQQAAAQSNAATQSQIQSQRTLREGMTSISTQLAQIQRLASVALGGSYIGGMLKDVADTADEFKNLGARVKLVTTDTQGYQQAMQGVADVSLATHSALEGTATLFARITKTGTDAGLSSQAAAAQALSLTTTINQAIQLSGSGADASKAAVTQLIQGLQSGVLRGEEFNSVMEQAPRLAQALAQGLGVTTGELRKMAEQGQLTSTTVIKALESQKAAVEREFATLPLTVGRALQDLQTRWTLYVGESDKGAVSSANVAKIIDALSENLDALVGTLYAAGKAWAAMKIAGIAADLVRKATATRAAVVATEADTVATIANTAAQASNAAAVRAAGAAHAEAATRAGTAAASVAKTGLVWRSVTALFGPMGFAVAALAPEIIGLARSAGEGAAKWMGYGKAIDAAEQSLRTQDEISRQNADTNRAMAVALEEARNKQFQLSKEAGGLIGRFDELRTKGDSAAEAIGKIGKDFDLASVPGIRDAASVLDKLVTAGKLSAAQFEAAWASALSGKDLAVFETNARAAFAGTTREAERLGQFMDASLREAVRRTGLDFDTLQGHVGAAARSAINDVESIVVGMDKLKAKGIDVGLVLSQSIGKAIQTADSQAAIDSLKARVESLRASLGDKVTDGLLDMAKLKAEDLRNKINELKAGIQDAAEAFSFFGIKSAAAMTDSANKSRAAYDILRNSGTATAEQLRDAFVRTANDAIAANKGIAPEWVKVEAAIRGVNFEAGEYGKTSDKVSTQSRRATDGMAEGWRGVGAAARQAGIDGMVSAEQLAQAAAKVKEVNAKYAAPEGKSIVGNTREERLAGQGSLDLSNQFDIRDKLRNGTLSKSDLAQAQAVLQQLDANEAMNRSLDAINPAGFSLEGMRDRQEWNAVRAQLSQLITAMGGDGQGGSKSRTVTVQLRGLDGNTSSIPTTDSGAQALIKSLQTAALAAGR